MFMRPSAASHSHVPQLAGLSASTSVLPGGSQQPFDPLRSDVVPRAPTTFPLHQDPLVRGPAGYSEQGGGLDPLAQVKPHQMAQSMRVQPTRPRLDAREAASKLANMF
jgi:hypothetical protein